MTSYSTERRATGRPVNGTLYRAQLVSAVGDGSFYVTSALFFSQLLGLSAVQIGVTLTVAWAVGFALTAPIGHLGDRLGLRGSAAVLSLATALALVLFVIVPSAYVAAMVLYAVAQSGSGAIRQALLVRLVEPEQRVVVRARLQSIVNGGIAAGAGLGGVALYLGEYAAYVGVFAFDAATFACAAVLLTRLPAVASRAAPADGAQRAHVLRDRPFVAAAALNAILYLYMPMLSVLLPLYIAHRTGAPGWMVAVLFVLNTGGVLALQLPAARRVAGLLGAAVSVRRGGWAMLGSCLAFWAASLPASPLLAAVALLAGITLQVLGEVCIAAGSWEIGFGLADPDRPGQWQGLYASAIPVARAFGPLALTALVLGWSGPGWLVLGGVFLAASFAMTPVVGRDMRRARVARSRQPAHV